MPKDLCGALFFCRDSFFPLFFFHCPFRQYLTIDTYGRNHKSKYQVCPLTASYQEHLNIFLTLLHSLCLKCPFCHLPVPVVPGYNGLSVSVSSTGSWFQQPLGQGVWKFELTAHGLNCITTARPFSSTATLKHLIFMIVACVIFYSLLSDYKQLKDRIVSLSSLIPKEQEQSLL